MAATANPLPPNAGTPDLSIVGPRTSDAKETNARLSVNRPVLNRAAAARMLEEENIFTFKPKVSPQSVKIAESLGTNFMSRQQQHLERQRRFLNPTNQRAEASLDKLNYTTIKKGQNQSSDSDDNSESPGVGNCKVWATPSTVPPPSDDPRGGSPPAAASQSSPALSKVTNVKPKSSPSAIHHTEDDEEDGDQLGGSRSRTMPGARPKLERKATTLGPHPDRVNNARLTAERAIKNRKIFTIQGPYPAIRESLRKRGWVEKFYKLHMAPPPKKSPRNKRKKPIRKDQDDDADDDDDDDDADDDDDGDDDDDDDADDHGGGKIPPWEEDNGVYGIMSRIVRNIMPTFIWSIRRDAVDPRHLRKEQVVNHYGKAIFTTKVGLCMNIRNVPWFEATDPDTFFPRCYRLSHEEEKQAFIDDFRMTACWNALKWVSENANDMPESIDEVEDEEDKENQKTCTNADCTKSVPGESVSNKCVHKPENTTKYSESKNMQNTKPIPSQSPRNQNKGQSVIYVGGQCLEPSFSNEMEINGRKKKKGGRVPLKLIDFALSRCTKYIKYREHADIDLSNEDSEPSEAEWDQIIQWYYQLVHEGATIPRVRSKLKEITEILIKLKPLWLQLDMDGFRNVWIVKPGAKSRGRGITCYDNLEEMLKLVSASVMKEGKFVVQKYIERPLLIYNTKFDIRQWFLVTDWNPLTIWFYKDSYLRFCSQQYTLDDFDQSIHLSNNAIQKYCVNGERSDKLPDENMWDSQEFISYLRSRGSEKVWAERIYPGMKKAVECALLCTQDIVECRKSAFELYGADFMLTEDYFPWLIEINSSPSMSYSTKVSHRLCSQVLEDTVKVVLDRKYDKNCDTGRFELSFKQPMVTVPPYIGLNLSLEGQSIKRPTNPVRRSEPAPSDYTSRYSFTKKTVTNTENGDYKSSQGAGDRNDRSRVLAHLTRDVPRVAIYSSERSGGKGGSHGGPAVGGGAAVGAAANTSSQANNGSGHSISSTSTDNPNNHRDSQISSSPKCAPTSSTSSSSSSTFKVVVGSTNLQPFTSTPPSTSAHPHPSKSCSIPKTHGTTQSASISTTPYNPNLNGMNSVLHASLQKLEADSLPIVNSTLRRPSEPRKLLGTHLFNSALDAEKEKLLSSERISLVKNHGPFCEQETTKETPGTEAIARGGHEPKVSLMPGAWAQMCSTCGKCRHARLESDPSFTSGCQCLTPDSIHSGSESISAPPTVTQLTSFTLPLAPCNSRSKSPLSRPRRPLSSKGHWIGKPTVPSNFHFEKPKLAVDCSINNLRNMLPLDLGKTVDGKFPIRYTDGGIRKPVMPARVVSNAFPRLVSRYVGKKTRDTLNICIDPYRQDNGLRIVNQSFL